MGFLNKLNAANVLREEHEAKLKEWAKKHPLTAQVMLTDSTNEEILAFINNN